MKLTVSILLLLCSASWVQISSAQATDGGPRRTPGTDDDIVTVEGPTGEEPDCTRGLGSNVPITVPDLPVCVDLRDQPQCCSREYILERLNISARYFRLALREELQRRFDLFRSIADRIREFLDSDFLDGLFLSFADLSYLRDRSSVIREFASELRDHLTIDRERDTREGREFRVRDLLERLVERVKEDAAEEYGTVVQDIKMCIRDLIQEKVDAARMEAFAEAVEQIRRVRTSIDRLRDFLDNLNETLAGFRPLQVCVDRLVELTDCGSCLFVRPRLCGNVCGALARACYSPFFDAFRDQFDRFWMVVREIVTLTGSALRRLNANRRIITIGRLELTAEAFRQCSVNITRNLPFPFGKRQADREDDDDRVPDIPSFVSDRISDLVGGAFEYERTGPRLCQAFVQTSSFNCWDGRRRRALDITRFTRDGIDGQDENPVIQIDTSALQQQSLALGSPVDTFLQDPSFVEVTPDGLTIPQSGGGGGSLGLGFTAFVLLTGLLAAFGFN